MLDKLLVSLVLITCIYVTDLQVIAQEDREGDVRPNILFLLADDMQSKALGSFSDGQVQTPNLDRLMGRGVVFTNCYNQGSRQGAVCIPSRAMLITGQHLWKLRDNNCQGHGLWSESLGDAGYETFVTGKWHNGPDALNRGFEQVGPTGPGMYHSTPKGGQAYNRPADGNTWQADDPQAKGHWLNVDGQTVHSSQRWVDESMKFLRQRDSDRPFFMHVAFHAPHDPRQAPTEFLDLYDAQSIPVPENFVPEHPFDLGTLSLRDELLAPMPRKPQDVQQHLAEYYAIISHLDAEVGRLLDEIDAQGLTDSTIIVFASDHGLAMGQHGLLGKQSLYEHSVKAPLILAGPGIPEGAQRDSLVYLHDLFPTTCDLAGVPVADSVDGQSMVDVIEGTAPGRGSIYTAYSNTMRAVRDDRFKLIVYPQLGRLQLFDLAVDPLEMNDLSQSNEHKEEIDELGEHLKLWMSWTGDPLLTQQIDQSLQSVEPKDPLEGIKPVAGVSARVWASTPMVMDPVAFCIDEKGRIFVAESFRQEHGVEDNRSQPYWLLDDLASQSIEDRLAKYEKWADKRANGMEWYTEKEDRIRRVEDTNESGEADKVTIYADGFNETLDGTGAGLIIRNGQLWYSCIPSLWQLSDPDDDGVADARSPLFTGFGVRDALRGHDMHGLVWGPDGRLYWSIGDRGYNVRSHEGKTYADPRAGAVFRCEPDGSDLEVFYYGLRNPQELAFDRYGYLFTGDNNSDAGDRARMTYVAEGGETGWEMNYQTLGGDNVRGPWVQEGLWETDHPERPAWSLPPLEHVSSGPSGLTAYPGQGLPERYDDHLFMCDFTGSPTNSSVLAMQMVPNGAGFRVEDVHPFVSGILCTDVDFNWDGSMVVSDWVEGWYSTETGRLIVLSSDDANNDTALRETAELMAQGINNRETSELLSLLSHRDMRVRQRAQFLLAESGGVSVAPLAEILRNPDAEQMARIHSLWALGMIARHGDYQVDDEGHPLVAVLEVTDNEDPEIRSQAARVLGDEAYGPAHDRLIDLVFDEEPRVVYHATMGLGRIGDPASVDAILEMLWANDNEDRWLRHAGVMALTRIDDRPGLIDLLGDPMPPIRLAALLALRRLEDPAVARLLRDPDPMIAAEAARAINDKPIAKADTALADVLPAMVRTSIESSPVDERAAAQGSYTVELERFDKVPFATSHDLETHASFERDPDEVLPLQAFVAPDEHGDKFISRMTGRIMVPESGQYHLALCSDDSSVLFIWPEGQPDQRKAVARVDDWVPKHTWDEQEQQVSDPIELIKGTTYILEARHCDRSGKDHLAIGWQKPDGTWERPIGAGMSEPTGTATRTEMAITRRALAATLRSGDANRINAVAALALDPTQPAVLRREAIDVLAQWPQPRPRDLVQGRYRPVNNKRNIEQWREAMARVMPALTQSHPIISVPAQEIAADHGIALDTTLLQRSLENPQTPRDQRQTMLRLLCRDAETRQPALETALGSDDPYLQSEAIRLLAQHDQEAALPLVLEALNKPHVQQQRSAIETLGLIDDPQTERALLELLQNIRTQPGPLRLDILVASQNNGGEALDQHLTEWQEVTPTGFTTAYGLASEGGDPTRGRELVFYHAGASCLRCHQVGGVGGEAGPSLDGVASRLSRAQLLNSLLVPQEVITEGYGEASAMPPMHDYLSPLEIRDVMAYLMTLESNTDEKLTR